jgi:mitochondrial fission protein ELM1
LALLNEVGARTALAVTLGGGPPPASLGGAEVRHLDLGRGWHAWPDGPFDAVVARDLLERLPTADVAWVLDEAFARAERAVLVQLRAQAAADGLGGPEWWRRRAAETAARYPGVSWHLDVAPPEAAAGAARSVGLRRVNAPDRPRVWVLTGVGEAEDRQVRRLAGALGWPFEERRLAYNGQAALPYLLVGPSLKGVDREASDALEAPWPDLVIAAGRRSAPVARWVRGQGGGRTRLVQLGRPAAPFELFDLVIATPDQRLPIRGNVLQLSAPLPAGVAPTGATDDLAPDLAGLPRPIVALLAPRPDAPYELTPDAARELAGIAVREAGAGGGSVAAWIDPRLPPEVADALRSGLTGEHRVLAGTGAEAASSLAAAADRVVLPGGAPGLLADACVAGRPVMLMETPRTGGGGALLRPFERLLGRVVGGSTYRGTPMQQHFPGRIVDWLVTQAWPTAPAT